MQKHRRQVQQHVFSAHRVVLAAAIPYFRAMFCHSGMKESHSQEVELAAELEPKILRVFIKYAYTGALHINCENVQQILMAANYLQLEQVQKVCFDFLMQK